MPDIGTKSEREVGRVIAVSNYRVTVLLDSEVRSQIRSFPYQITTITQIGGYLLFPVSPGESVVGIIVWASENEIIEPEEQTGVTLQLGQARRILKLNLIGQLREGEPFKPGVSIYPNLDTPALLPFIEELHSILEFQSMDTKLGNDVSLPIGISSVYSGQEVTCSFNDIFARPLGIIGNTGSGKSWSVASIIKSSLFKLFGKEELESDKPAPIPKFILLDINGEYGEAFFQKQSGDQKSFKRELNKVYINGKEFSLPIWIFDLNEMISFFEASQASQVPVLEMVVTSIREDSIDTAASKAIRQLVRIIVRCLDIIASLSVYSTQTDGMAVRKNTEELLSHLESHASDLIKQAEELELKTQDVADMGPSVKKIQEKIIETVNLELSQGGTQKEYIQFRRLNTEVQQMIEKLMEDFDPILRKMRGDVVSQGDLKIVTVDSPVRFDPSWLERGFYFDAAVSRQRGEERIREYIATMKLRIHRMLTDKRWAPFITEGKELMQILEEMIGSEKDPVIVVDCSMLANDVLPYFCAIFSRVLLELREHAKPDKRIVQPFVLVLEEAHNYLKPPQEREPPGLRLARHTFERIAREGRKFGLSLIVASQRPCDVSATVLSQCANFIVHRIQNPEDIDYFKKVLPLGSRDLLDQVPILAPGDGFLMGSSVNVPVRVKVNKPVPPPMSETSRPWEAWQPMKDIFDFKESMNLWLRELEPESEVDLPKLSKKKKTDIKNDQ
jgi:DNA helicase HerA-like ATPase/uncharacterized protein YoxC